MVYDWLNSSYDYIYSYVLGNSNSSLEIENRQRTLATYGESLAPVFLLGIGS